MHRNVAALAGHFEAQRLALQRALQHAPAQVLPGGDAVAFDRAHRVAGGEVRRLRQRAGRRLRQHRAGFRHAVHVQAGIDRDREQEIEQRAGADDDDPAPDALPVEGAVQVLGVHGRLALVEHLDVAAERNRGERPFGRVAPDLAGVERAPEADRKAQHLDVAQARREVVAVLVHHDQHAERDHEGSNGVQDIQAAFPISSATDSTATRRAFRSASSTFSRESGWVAAERASVCSITCGIAV